MDNDDEEYIEEDNKMQENAPDDTGDREMLWFVSQFWADPSIVSIREEKIELFPLWCKNLALRRANLELFVHELKKKQPKTLNSSQGDNGKDLRYLESLQQTDTQYSHTIKHSPHGLI